MAASSTILWGLWGSEAIPAVPGWSLGEAESTERVRADCHLLQDSYPRFLKSDMYKGLLAEAVIPPEVKRW